MATGITLDRARTLVLVTAEANDGRLATDKGSISQRAALAMVDVADAATTDLDRGRLALFLTSEILGERRTRKLYLRPDAQELARAREQIPTGPATVTTTGVNRGERIFRDVEVVIEYGYASEIDFIPAGGDRPAQTRIFVKQPWGVSPMLVVKGSIRSAAAELEA